MFKYNAVNFAVMSGLPAAVMSVIVFYALGKRSEVRGESHEIGRTSQRCTRCDRFATVWLAQFQTPKHSKTLLKKVLSTLKHFSIDAG